MNCEKVLLLLNGYVDGELDLVTSLEIEEHLRECASCSAQHQSLVALHTATADKALYHLAPAGLEKRIRGSLKKANPKPPFWEGISWRWLAPAAALVILLLLLAGTLGRSLMISNQQTLLTQEVQVAHVRSLMANHLVDVASTDQHTVKPWFNGKLDFSPPVTDLAPQGFPLVGGRLEYLDGRQVAALVYQRNKHYINLFIWPSQDKEAGPQRSDYNGYHLFHWTQSGMTFWAVSDVNPKDLVSFIQAYRKSTQ